jgi:hypothetical protein|nr:MAG TPA: protein of unknown function (DUF4585) [Caudoviricetes sp.]
MAFDIPRVSGTVQPNKLIDDTQLISVLARQILASRLAQARAAAGGGRRGGGRGNGSSGKVTYANVLDPKTGKYVQVPITGNSKDERKANLQALEHNQTVDSVRADPALSKLDAVLNDPKASNETKRETLASVRKELSQKYGGTDDASAIIARELAGANNQVKTEKKAIDDTSGFSSLIDSARIGAESLSNWISTLGDDDRTRDRKDQESQQRIQAIIDSNPDLKETDLRTREGRGLTDRNDDFMGTARNMVNTMVQDPGTALQTIGTAAGVLGASALTGGTAAVPLAGVIGGTLAGAAGNAVSGDVGLRQRLAEDETLSEDQRIAAYNDAKYREAAMNAAIGGASGLIPAAASRIGAGLIRSGTGSAGREARSMAEDIVDKTLTSRAAARQSAEVPAETITSAERQQMVNQVMRDETAPYIIQREVLNRPVKYGAVPAVAEGAASNAVNTLGSNANYNAATGENNSITNGIGESALYGGLMAGAGGALGLAGRRILNRNNTTAPEAPAPMQYRAEDFAAEKKAETPAATTNPTAPETPASTAAPEAPAAPTAPEAPATPTAPEAPASAVTPETPASPATLETPASPAPEAPIAPVQENIAAPAQGTPAMASSVQEHPVAPSAPMERVETPLSSLMAQAQRSAPDTSTGLLPGITPDMVPVGTTKRGRQQGTAASGRKRQSAAPQNRDMVLLDLINEDRARQALPPITTNTAPVNISPAGKRRRSGNTKRNQTNIQGTQSVTPDGTVGQLREGTVNPPDTNLNSPVAANTAGIIEPITNRNTAEIRADNQGNQTAGSGRRPNENAPAPENYAVNAGEQGSTAGRPEPADRGRGTESATVGNAESGQSTGSLGTERSTDQRSPDTGEKPKPLIKVQRQKMHDSLQDYFSSTGTEKLSNEQAADMLNSLFLRQDEAASSAVKSAPNLTSLIHKRGQYALGRKAPKSIGQMFPKEVGNIITDRMNRYKESNGQDSSALFTADDVDEIKYFSDMLNSDRAHSNLSADAVSPEKLSSQTEKAKKAFDGDNDCIS